MRDITTIKKDRLIKETALNRFKMRYRALLLADDPSLKSVSIDYLKALGAVSWADAMQRLIPQIHNYSYEASNNYRLTLIDRDRLSHRKYRWDNLSLVYKGSKPKFQPRIYRALRLEELERVREILRMVRGERVDSTSSYVTDLVDAKKLHHAVCRVLKIPHRGLGTALIRRIMTELGWEYSDTRRGQRAHYRRVVKKAN